MPRRPRVFADGAIYHVYCRFAHAARVFAAEEEAGRFVEILRDVARTDGLSILAWCLMPTHYHLAVRTGRLPLWRSLRLIQGRFAVGHNLRHCMLGPLWQGRYKARVVDGQDSLNRLVAYIHLNPVKAGLAPAPARYRWSGHRELLGRVRRPLADVDAALALFGRTRARARQAYAAMVRAVGREAWALEAPGGLPWWRREAGASEALGRASRGPILDALGASTAAPRVRASVEKVLAAVGAETGLEVRRLAARVQDRGTVRARELAAVVAVHRCGAQVKEVGRRLGKPADTVSRWLTRGARRQVEDEGFAREVKRVEARLKTR